MPSSTSSSNARLPRGRWGPVLGAAVLAWALCLGALELRLAQRGFAPTLPDSEAAWIAQRARAAALGERALVLIGGSRMLLDADLDLLRERTGLEPVQLAIDGTSFRPILAGLAADEAVRGTVIVDVSDHLLASTELDATAQRAEAAYAIERGRRVPDFDRSERRLTAAWRGSLRSYADGARPLTSLLGRALAAQPTPQYVVARPDRSRLADYAQANVRVQYLARAVRAVGGELPRATSLDELERELVARVAAVQPATGEIEAYLRGADALAAQAAAIRARGGRVLFAMLPKSGLVREIEERRYPRAQFWDRFAARAGAPTVHFEDVAAWRGLQCPDGSHLDFRQRAAFSEGLVAAFGLSR